LPNLAQLDRLFWIDARARSIVAAHPAHAARVATWRARFSRPLVEALFARATTGDLTVRGVPAACTPAPRAVGTTPSSQPSAADSPGRAHLQLPGAARQRTGCEREARPAGLTSRARAGAGQPSPAQESRSPAHRRATPSRGAPS
jgi:hypothetical protein